MRKKKQSNGLHAWWVTEKTQAMCSHSPLYCNSQSPTHHHVLTPINATGTRRQLLDKAISFVRCFVFQALTRSPGRISNVSSLCVVESSSRWDKYRRWALLATRFVEAGRN